MSEKFEAFIKKIQNDDALRAQFEEACTLEDVDEARRLVRELARQVGVDLQEEDFAYKSAVDEADLETVTGGSGGGMKMLLDCEKLFGRAKPLFI